MLRFAIVGAIPQERAKLRDALTRCAQEAHHANVDVVSLASVEALHASASQLRIGYYDVALVHLDSLRPQARTDALRERLESLQTDCPQLPLVLVTRDTSRIELARELGIRLCNPADGLAGLRRALRDILGRLGWEHQRCLAIRSSTSIDNIAIDDILFVESSRRGPIIHLPDNRSLVTRGTLKGLFDLLTGEAYADTWRKVDGDQAIPFVTAGSSFIVNLENVVASGKGTLVFAGGATIIVPVRKRKEVREALAIYRTER